MVLKRILTLLFLTFTLVNTLISQSSSNFNNDELSAIKSALEKGVGMSHDKFENKIWIKSRAVAAQNPFTTIWLYFSLIKDDSGNIKVGSLKIANNLRFNSWIFMNKIYYLVGDKADYKNNTTRSYTLSDESVNRTVISGGVVNELSIVTISDEIKDFIDYVLKTEKDIEIKYSGSKGYVIRKTKGKFFIKAFPPLLNTYDKISTMYKK